MDQVLNNKWLKFLRKHGSPRQRGSNSLWKHSFPRQMDPSCHEQTWFSHVPSLLEVNSCSPRNFKLVCKFPKITIKLQFPFSLEDLSQPFFFFFFATWPRKWGQNCTTIWELSPKKCSQVPQGKHSLNSCSSKRIVFLWTSWLGKWGQIACTNTILFPKWLLHNFQLKKSYESNNDY